MSNTSPPKRRGRPPLPKLDPWSARGIANPADPEDWQLASFAPWPKHGDATVPGQNYVRKNLATAVVESDAETWSNFQAVRSVISLLVRVFAGNSPPTSQLCRLHVIAGRRGNKDSENSDYCDTWSCEECAKQKVIPPLVSAYQLMRLRATVTVLEVPSDVFRADTFRRAVGRGHDCDDPDLPTGWTWGVQVARGDGETVFAYTSARITGRTLAPYAVVMDSIDAFEHFRTMAMALPGVVRKPDWCGQLKLPSNPPASTASDWRFHGRFHTSNRDSYRSERDRIARRDHNANYLDLLDAHPDLADQTAREAALRLPQPP